MTETLQAYLFVVVLGMVISLCIATFRLVKGPTAPDRVIAGDAMTSIIIALMVILSVYYGEAALLDLALVIAFLGFIGTLAISKYLEGRGLED